MALILAVANEKGGCGKTTTAMNLAGGLHLNGRRVLVVDADPQASATMWSIARGQGSLPFDVQTSRQIRGQFSQYVESPDYDVVLVDCPPGVVDAENIAGKAARAAIREADAILVPLRPSTLDFSAAANFVRFLSAIQEPGQRVLVLINGRQNTLLSRQAHHQAQALFQQLPCSHVLTTAIGQRVAIAEVCGSGQTIFAYAPASEAAREYTRLTQEILECLKSAPPLPPT